MATTTSILPTIQIDVNFRELAENAKEFFTNYKNADGLKYMNILQQIANREITSLVVELDDLQSYAAASGQSNKLVNAVLKNTHHFVELFSKVVDELMPEPTSDVSYKDDVLDVIIHQRKLRNARLQQDAQDELVRLSEGINTSQPTQNAENAPIDLFPAALTRRYCLYFAPLTAKKHSLAVREVKGAHLGQYISVKGIVTRVSDVKPAVLVTAYTCDKCGFEIFQEVTSRTFSPLTECSSPQCKADNVRGQLFMSTRASKFSAFQEVKIQELADQVPVGHIPRTLGIHVNGDLVRSLNPGDIAEISGIFMPAPYTGFRALKAGLLTETFLEAQHVKQLKKQEAVISDSLKDKVEQIHAQGNAYERLAQSIAPEIFGHADVKKILLLLLTGGVSKNIGDGLRIRGDINVCLMGDPGVAKSQLLKAVGKIAPRSVYTTGRGSSGVGLTAAVMRDPVTDEMVLEGGALVLADNGICCIDEFDKMDESDRTAIHEVMEQQTISISKAGINTTLNARTSILAAANPIYGRYNTKLSAHENVNLPAALFSRFDIMYLLLDQPSRENDEQLAHHVAYVHMHSKQPNSGMEPVDIPTIRQYVSVAQEYRPVVPPEVGEYVVQAYIGMRKEARRNEGSTKQSAPVTPRTLLGVLRLAQAHARIRFSNVVTAQDVDEALRLIAVSQASLHREDEQLREDESASSKIYQIVKSMATKDGRAVRSIPISELLNQVVAKGYTVEHFDACISEYEYLNVWQRVDEGETLMFIGADAEDDEMEY